MAKKAINFKSKQSLRNWEKYGHATGVFESTPGNTPVKVKGKSVKVNHKKGGK